MDHFQTFWLTPLARALRARDFYFWPEPCCPAVSAVKRLLSFCRAAVSKAAVNGDVNEIGVKVVNQACQIMSSSAVSSATTCVSCQAPSGAVSCQARLSQHASLLPAWPACATHPPLTSAQPTLAPTPAAVRATRRLRP